MSVDSENARLRQTQAETHPFCFVCSGSNPMGLALRYRAQPDGSVAATFRGNCTLEGFTGLLHGGLIAALLDGAMTNCLFAHGSTAMTAELKVRYREPVTISEEMHIQAWMERSWPPLYLLRAELKQGDRIKATAAAKFMERT
jgi:acyl-coenzyme A thioesterase PaaI-like protein